MVYLKNKMIYELYNSLADIVIANAFFFLITFKATLTKDTKPTDYLSGVGNVVRFRLHDLSSKNETDSSPYHYGFIISIRRVGVYNPFLYYSYVVQSIYLNYLHGDCRVNILT